MTFADALFKCFHKFNQFDGRAGRLEFWWFQLFFWSLCTLCLLLDMMVGINFLYNVAFYGLLIPEVSVAFRRMQDAGYSGLYAFIPFVNIFIACLPGDIDENEYGEEPID